MSGGEEDFLTPTFHEVVFALIRWKLDEFDADPVGYIERERANHPEPVFGWENPTGNKKRQMKEVPNDRSRSREADDTRNYYSQ